MSPTQTVSSDDARRFRESASVPLTWDETIPPPPLDRIEFTRHLLQASRKAGFDVSAWNTSIADEDPEKRFEMFQKDIASFLPKQTFEGVPTVRFSISNGGFHGKCVRAMNWGEYIEQLEYEYLEPWEQAWKFGASPTSRQILRDWLLHLLASRPEFSAGGIYVAQPAYSNAKNITGHEIVSSYLHLRHGNSLMVEIERQIGAKIPLIKERQFGLPVEVAVYFPPVIGLLCLGFAIYGAVAQRFSGWWLLLIIPVIFIGVLSLFLVPYRSHWQNKSLTFNNLFDQIIAAKTHDWAELQHAYKEN